MIKKFIKIGSVRLLNIRVILNNDSIIYEGMSDDAPNNIKDLVYSKVEVGSPIIYYVYN